MQIQIDLDGPLLRGILGFRLVPQQQKQQKVDSTLTRADEFMEQMSLTRQDPADAFGLELWVGNCSHRRPGGGWKPKPATRTVPSAR
jgi:hypothetical protein